VFQFNEDLAVMTYIILTRNNNNFRCSIPYFARSKGIYSHVIELFRPAKSYVLLLEVLSTLRFIPALSKVCQVQFDAVDVD